MNNPANAIWEIYTSAWKAQSMDEKLRALRTSTSTDADYRDPLAHTRGHDELVNYMLDFHRQIPGGYFETVYFLAHHDRSIARWNMRNGQGELIGDGISYGEYGGDGLLNAMTGFFVAPQ